MSEEQKPDDVDISRFIVVSSSSADEDDPPLVQEPETQAQAEPAEPDAEEPQEAAAEAEEVATQGNSEPDGDGEDQRMNASMRRRIARERAKTRAANQLAHAMQATQREIMQEIANLKAQLGVKGGAAEPDPSQFDSFEAYEAARAKPAPKPKEADAQQAAEAELLTAVSELLDPDVLDRVQTANIELPISVVHEIHDSEDPDALTTHLLDNPKVAKRLARLQGRELSRAVARIETRLEAGAQQTVRRKAKQSAAPAPIKPERSSAPAADPTRMLENGDIAGYMRAVEAEVAATRKRGGASF